MRRPRLLVSILACVLALGVVIWLILPPGIPNYKGRPLTDWVKDGYGAPSTREQLKQANEAVRAVGTNALEFWVATLGSTNDSKITEIENSIFGPRSRFHRPDSSERSSLAFCALYILGADAKPAIPKLTKLLNYRYTQPNANATIILAGLGLEGVEALTNALADTNLEMRYWIAATLGGWNGKPPNFQTLARRGGGPWEWPAPVMKAIVPTLARCLKDRDDNMRIFSAQSLGMLGKEPATIVPALAEYLAGETNAVGRTTGLEALARFGKAAKPARSEITPLLNDPDPQTRRSATNAFKKIDPEGAAQAGVK